VKREALGIADVETDGVPRNQSIATPTCYQHPSRDRVARCVLCGRAICADCVLHTHTGVTCPSCAASPKRAVQRETAVPWRVARAPILPIKARRRLRRRWGCVLILAISVATLLAVGWAARGWRFAEHRISPKVQVTTSGSYKFLANVNGSPVSYNPCRPIRYELNLIKAPPGAEGILGVAIQNVERATGLKFEYVGVSNRRPLDKASRTFPLGRTKPPVIISWATPEEAPALAGNVAGYAGSSYIADKYGPTHFATGQVVLDSEVFARLV
jgi:hypothetical protein